MDKAQRDMEVFWDMTTEPQSTPGVEEDWDLVSGLPNDTDAWVRGATFGGGREEYQAVAGGQAIVLTLPLVNADGEEVGQQNFSVGSGWIASDDGESISHPVRKNIVRTSRYGLLIKRVKDELGVDMASYGSPFSASTWDDLGFHWMLEKHATVSGEEKEGLMPTEFLGDSPPYEGEGGAESEEGASIPEELDVELTKLAKGETVANFQRKATRLAAFGELSDEAIAHVMNRGEDGYWATHK